MKKNCFKYGATFFEDIFTTFTTSPTVSDLLNFLLVKEAKPLPLWFWWCKSGKSATYQHFTEKKTSFPLFSKKEVHISDVLKVKDSQKYYARGWNIYKGSISKCIRFHRIKEEGYYELKI